MAKPFKPVVFTDDDSGEVSLQVDRSHKGNPVLASPTAVTSIILSNKVETKKLINALAKAGGVTVKFGAK